MSENLVFGCQLKNLTGGLLKLKYEHLDWGKWTDLGNHAPVDLEKKFDGEAFRSSGRQSTATGTTGTVIYQLGDNPDQWVKIYWSIPWVTGSTNTLELSTYDHDRLVVQHNGFAGQGSVEIPRLVVARVAE
ncbi:aegerolysin family protein [Streptomyces sp. x-80]|uniref:aegerolysin family protein n=1 Tax=Streptomyces sp. x-80 TaxID=2789282 RepID=UPI00397F1FF4